jgi:predicted DNA-binding transcriptional regulator YafY
LSEGAFGLIGGKRERIRIFFNEKVARFMPRRQWHPSQKIRNVTGGIVLTMDVAGSVEVASWVLGFGDKATVLEPATLRDQVAAELRRAVAKY